jgi:anti-sigma regulatory factor (Ser/Thr protein kinase)
MIPGYSASVASVTVPNRVESVRPAVAFIVQMSRALKVPQASRPLFEVAVSEALANAVKYGRDDRGEDAIMCELELSARQLTLRIIDGGKGFVIPTARLPHVDPADTQSLPESGYGLPIIQSVFPAVRTIRAHGRFGLELGLPLR